ncbi:MAG: class I SAM-dependent methyltransferase [Acidimicrobiales bacterium]
MTSPTTILRNALRPGYCTTMADKVLTRITDRRHSGTREAATAWAAERAEPSASFAARVDPVIWEDAQRFTAQLERIAAERLGSLRERGVVLGGGGDYGLLYFLTRLLRPSVVVETGVAAGFSSQAFLRALADNGDGGRLWSSDFPYFRLENPEQYVGLLVDDELRPNWQLYLRGDRVNLRRILAEVDHIDLFHYDSDKSYRGRAFALGRVRPRLSVRSHVVFDDIDDNSHFRDLVERTGAPYRVFGFGNKYLGLIGELAEA